MTTIKSQSAKAVFALLLMFVMVFPSSYTADHAFGTHFVILLSVCRVAVFFAAIVYILARANRIVAACRHHFFWAALFVLVVAAVSGLPNIVSNWRAYAQHGFQYAFIAALFLVGRLHGKELMRPKLLLVMSVAAIVSYAMAATIYLTQPALHIGVYSFQPNLLLLPISAGLAQANYLVAIPSALLLILGNKRAVLIGAFIVVSLFVALRYWQGDERGAILRRSVAAITLASSLSILVPASLTLLSGLGVPLLSVGERITGSHTFTASDPKGVQEDDSGLLKLTSGRNVEASAVWDVLQDRTAGWLIGTGLGASFRMAYLSPITGAQVDYMRNQADVLAFHIALTSGIPAAVTFLACLILTCASIFFRMHLIERASLPVALFAIGLLPDIILGFNATNPIVWAALGYITERNRQGSAVL